MKKLVIIDGNSLLFRAYFAMRPMVTSKGIHTQGVFAFINMLNKIITEYNPDYIAVAFDMKEKTFRHEYYPEYKAGRQQTPIELLSEIPYLHRVLEAMNIAVLEMPRYEADDLIGTVVKRASAEGIKSLVISGDKDELQLVDENTNVLINKKGMSEFTVYDIAAMKDRYKLTPQQFIDLKGLMGDSSDNIPGIPGIGEKKGIALLEKYGSVEDVIEHADEIPGKMGENVRNNIDLAILSKKLATINVDSPIDFTWEELEFVMPDYDKLIDVYTELEFNKFIAQIKSNATVITSDETIDSEGVDFSFISTISFEEFTDTIESGAEVCIYLDTDNNHLDAPEVKAVYLYSYDNSCYACKEITPMDAEIIISKIVNKKWALIANDIKNVQYSIKYFTAQDIIPLHDIVIAEYLLDPNRNKYELPKIILRHLGLAIGENISVLEQLHYICLIKQEQIKLLKERGLINLFNNVEMPLTTTIVGVEIEGISCDAVKLNDIGSDINIRVSELESYIYELATKQFNINSPKQLGVVLFDDMEIPYPKVKSATGTYSTAADILDKLAGNYPIVDYILEYRKLTKLKSTYVDGLTALIATDGKIHPHFKQTVAATGRLSCIEPNLQNIPIRDDYGRSIRKAFDVSNSDNIFIGSDYSQIELRVLASLSHDVNLIEAFNQGEDIHRSTASRVFDIPIDKVTPIERTRAKAVNFGVVYGMSSHGLSESLNVTRAEAQHYIDEYFEKHSAVKEYLESLIKEGEECHEVRTYYGRIRQIPEFASRKYMERELAKRLAMNTPIQGTAADIIKIAMNSVYTELAKAGLKSKLILQIHDELIIEGPEYEAVQVTELLRKCMENAAQLDVNLECDIHEAKNWYNLK